MNFTIRSQDKEEHFKECNNQVENCNHNYGETQYDPEIVKVPYGFIIKEGANVGSKPSGYREEKKDRWYLECEKCGHKLYTYITDMSKIFCKSTI